VKEASILVVDDDPDTLRAYARVLRAAGHSVSQAANAEECLLLAARERPALILLDAVLPDRSGFDVCQQLKSTPGLSETMVLIISGMRTSAEHQAEGAWVGADGYLIKPAAPPALLSYVRALLRLREARLENARVLRSLEAERSRLSHLFTLSPSFVALLRGPQHVFELANPSYMALVGERQVLGRPAREALPDLEGQGLFELLDRVYETGEPHVGKETPVLVRRGEGEHPRELFVNFVYQPMTGDGGEVTGIFVHGVDVTPEVTARREAEDANRLKDDFLATLSHELRTPLTAVLGWANMLGGGQLDAATTERAIRVIERNASAQMRLIDDLLDVSRIITGKLRIDARPVELAQVIAQAVESVRPAAEARGVGLRAEYDPETGLVFGDPARLQQVVWNLLSNAVKFTPGGGRVEVRLASAGRYAEVSVTDTGEGINEAFLPYVFDRFRQAKGGRSQGSGGLGLGLAIVRQLVELHGGEVRAESEGEGRGATFRIRIPLSEARPAF
jgi:signal transduction histidine kinase